MSKNSKCPLDCAVKGCGTSLCRRYKDYEQGRAEARTEFAEWLCEKLDMNVDKILEEYERSKT